MYLYVCARMRERFEFNALCVVLRVHWSWFAYVHVLVCLKLTSGESVCLSLSASCWLRPTRHLPYTWLS